MRRRLDFDQRKLENLREKFLKLKEAYKSKGQKINLKKNNMMVSGLKEETFKSKADPCAKCG